MILRKAYGLGAQAMAGGSLHEPLLTVGWPTAELGAMGLEGAVSSASAASSRRSPTRPSAPSGSSELVAHAHEHAKALNAATLFELDDVIDPGTIPEL